MTHEWTVTRGTPNGQVVLGVFDLGGGLPCASLERLAVMIPEGRYRVVLTVSNRAMKGTLWSPYEDHKLPELLGVPGRTAIRSHAGNHIMDTEGCILVAGDHSATELMHSRPALTRIVNELRHCDDLNEDVYLTVQQGKDQG